MEQSNLLHLRTQVSIKAQNAGLFISPGTAPHVTRVIDSHELIFIKSGELEMFEEDRLFHLMPGQTLHLYPNMRHGGIKIMPVGLRFYWIHFEVDSAHGDGRRKHDEFATSVKIPQTVMMAQPERLERLFRTFLDDQETGLLNPTSANLLTMLMLVEVAQAQEERPAEQDELNVVATWAHTYIRINYDRPITSGKVAYALGYNADYLGRIYRQVYGCTLTDAIHERRIHMACEFLLNTQWTIEQIASKCGFTDPDYFRRIFRRRMKIPPSEYRSEYAHVHVNTHQITNIGT